MGFFKSFLITGGVTGLITYGIGRGAKKVVVSSANAINKAIANNKANKNDLEQSEVYEDERYAPLVTEETLSDINYGSEDVKKVRRRF